MEITYVNQKKNVPPSAGVGKSLWGVGGVAFDLSFSFFSLDSVDGFPLGSLFPGYSDSVCCGLEIIEDQESDTTFNSPTFTSSPTVPKGFSLLPPLAKVAKVAKGSKGSSPSTVAKGSWGENPG